MTIMSLADVHALALEYDSAPKVPTYTGVECAPDIWGHYGDWLHARKEQLLHRTGVTVVEDPIPYTNVDDMIADIRDQDRSYKVTTHWCSDCHPAWDVDTQIAYLICHDIDGHYRARSDFTLAGEEMAFASQTLVTPPSLWQPLFCELVMQLSSNLVNLQVPTPKLVLTQHYGILAKLAAGA